MFKRIMVVFLVMACVGKEAYAVANGGYLGVMAGKATNNSKTLNVEVAGATSANDTTPATPKTNQAGLRVFVGNQLITYAAIEGGFDFFTPINYTTAVNTCTSTKSQVFAFDVVGKGILPIWRINLFAKAGGAGVYVTTSGDANPAFDPNTNTRCGKKTTSTRFGPVYSIGASYDINPNWVADISSTRYQVNSNIVKNFTLTALGISYHFVDKYCGQFLCEDGM